MTHPEIERLRRDLRRAHLRPAAWWQFLSGSWAVAQATARESPELQRTWRRRALWRAPALPLLARVLGCTSTSLPWWATYAVQQADLYVHLGLNRAPEASAVRGAFPLATEVTLLRAYAAAALWGGTTRPRLALGVGLLTDVLDGCLARYHDDETALGALLDGEYDALLWLAAARVARRQRVLSAGGEAVLWLRFGAPLLAGVLAYAAAPHAVLVRSHWAGKLAGVMQAATLWAALSGRLHPGSRGPAAILGCSAAMACAAHVVQYWTAAHRPDDSSLVMSTTNRPDGELRRAGGR